MIASSQSSPAGNSFVRAVGGLSQGSTTPVPKDSVELLLLRQDCFKISHLGWQSSVTSYLPFLRRSFPKMAVTVPVGA